MEDWASDLLNGNHDAVVRALGASGVDSTSGGRSAISFAAETGDEHLLRWLVQHGAKLDGAVFPRSLLHDAAGGGCLGFVKHLVNSGADIDEEDGDGSPPLADAVFHGHVQVAKLLLDRGATLDMPAARGAWQGFAPLEFAVYRGAPNCTRLLVERGAKFHAGTPLFKKMFAAREPDERTDIPEDSLEAFARALLDRPIPEALRADPFVAVASAISPLLTRPMRQAAERFLARLERGGRHEVFEGDPLELGEGQWEQRVEEAVDAGDLEALRPLLKPPIVDRFEHADYDDLGDDERGIGRTPLHTAVANGWLDVARALLVAGFNPNRWQEPEGQNPPECPLGLALAADNPAMVELLLEHGASLSPPDFVSEFESRRGEVEDAISLARYCPLVEVYTPALLDTLLKRFPNTEKTPAVLFEAIASDDLERVEVLLRHGFSGVSAMKAATEGKQEPSNAMIELLVQHGAQRPRKRKPKPARPRPWHERFADPAVSNDAILGAIQSQELPVHEGYFQAMFDYRAASDDKQRLFNAGLEAYQPYEPGPGKLLGIVAGAGERWMLERVLEPGVDVNASASGWKPEPENIRDTAIYQAALNLRVDNVELLLERGAAPAVPAFPGHSPDSCLLGLLTRVPHYGGDRPKAKLICELMLARGLDVTSEFLSACGTPGAVESVDLMLELVPELARARYGSENALGAAAECHDARIIKRLLEAGARLDASEGLFCAPRSSPLHRAVVRASDDARERVTQTVEALLEAGADVNALDVNGDTPLDLAQERWLRELLRARNGTTGRVMHERASASPTSFEPST